MEIAMKVGVQIILDKKSDVAEKIKKAASLGFKSAQIVCWQMELYTDDNAQKIINACKEYDVTISSFWAGWSGPKVWNFVDGPSTLGIVPPDYRYQRMQELMQGSDFAKKIGVDKVATHAGFIPECPSDPNYRPVVSAIRHLANYCKANGQCFLFETGQETPTTLLRTIESVGTGNLGINLDTANPILYGKANPLDALDVFGKYVMDTHIKDGFYPTNGMYLGHEARAGDGRANIPAVVVRLINEFDYNGPFTIEREISGEQQIADIIHAKELLEDAMANAITAQGEN